jgi:hypothetical protein
MAKHVSVQAFAKLSPPAENAAGMIDNVAHFATEYHCFIGISLTRSPLQDCCAKLKRDLSARHEGAAPLLRRAPIEKLHLTLFDFAFVCSVLSGDVGSRMWQAALEGEKEHGNFK